MSTEFIIGTIIGLIGLVPVVIQFFHWIRKPKLSDLMKRLVDKSLSTKAHRRVLRKMNRKLLPVGKHISSEYINSFVLNKRGKEEVFADLCIKNGWEPTKELCLMFMNADYPTIRGKYLNMNNSRQNLTGSNEDKGAEFAVAEEKAESHEVVYLSALLEERFPDSFNRLMSIFKKHDVDYCLLKGTKDIWCKDYMPIQTRSGKLIQFRYDPSYLKGKKEWEVSRSDTREVCMQNGLVTINSNINLDGGNVLLCSDRAIVSDRIYTENPEFPDKEQLVQELSDLLEAEVIVIPAQKSDMTGHADGMVRFVDRNTIIGNNLADEYKYWREGMQKVIKEYGLKYIDIPFFEAKDPKHPLSAVGIYVNYLELKNLIVLPVFGREEDGQVLSILKETFPAKTIETVNYNEVAQEGGLLNCTTWVAKFKTT
jgi:agmatine/peptidylarginine deiminase